MLTDNVKYRLKVGGMFLEGRMGAYFETKEMAEFAKAQLPENLQQLAVIVEVNTDGQQILME